MSLPAASAATWLSEPANEAVVRSRDWAGILAFAASVCAVLTFTQCWLMPLTGPNGDPDASTLIRTVYFPAYGAAAALIANRPLSALKTAIRLPLLWLLLGYAAASMLWSIDPETTQRRIVALLFTTLAALAIASRYTWPRLVEVLASAYAVVVVLSFALALLLPSYGVMHDLFPGAWRGVYQEKNALGDSMTVAFTAFAAAAVLNPARRRLWIGFAAAAVALVLLSTSKTSLVTLVISAAAMGFVALARRGGAISVAATFAAVTGVLVLALAVMFASDLFFALLGKDATFTGRTVIWDSVLRLIRERPWTGYGYAAIWTDESGWGPLAWIIKWAHFRPHHAHNSWLETWLALGIPGLAIWAALFVETWGRTLWSAYTRSAAVFVLPFLMVYSLTTLTESVAFIYNDVMWLIFSAMALRLARGRSGDAAARP